jgi:hypothetical protein
MDRGQRRARTERIVARRVKWWQTFYGPQTGRVWSAAEMSPEQRGRSRKMHPTDCGNPRCWLCHSEKLSAKPLPREVRQMDATREEIGGMNGSWLCDG